MKILIRLEEAIMFGLTIYLFKDLGFAWWWYAVLILTPDIGMIGYVINTKTGAWVYNLFHHKGIAVMIYIIGLSQHNEIVQLAGLILFGHSSLDRMLGYGLKYEDDFKHTHLERIGES